MERNTTSIFRTHNSALMMETECPTYPVTTHRRDSVDVGNLSMWIWLFLTTTKMPDFLKRSGSVESPTIIQVRCTYGWHIMENCLRLITADCSQFVMAETQIWRIDPFVLQRMGICHVMVVTTCHIQLVCTSCQCQYTCHKFVPGGRVQENVYVCLSHVWTYLSL